MHPPEEPMKRPDILLYQEFGIIKTCRSGCHLAGASKDELLQYFLVFVSKLIGDHARYLDLMAGQEQQPDLSPSGGDQMNT